MAEISKGPRPLCLIISLSSRFAHPFSHLSLRKAIRHIGCCNVGPHRNRTHRLPSFNLHEDINLNDDDFGYHHKRCSYSKSKKIHRPYAILNVIPALMPPDTIIKEPGFLSQDGGADDTWVSLR